jgi:hypothetical protein
MLKGRRFEVMKDIKRNVTKELLTLHANEFENCSQQIYERGQKRGTSQGGYSEEY